MDRDKLKRELIRDEDNRLDAYRDSEGHWTIGVGHYLDDKSVAEPRIKRITPAESMAFLDADVKAAIRIATELVPSYDRDAWGFSILTWNEAEDVRSRALVNMAFNLGNRLGGFTKFLLAMNQRKWDEAAVEMMDSKWAGQVGDRAKRLRDMIRTGKEPA